MDLSDTESIKSTMKQQLSLFAKKAKDKKQKRNLKLTEKGCNLIINMLI